MAADFLIVIMCFSLCIDVSWAYCSRDCSWKIPNSYNGTKTCIYESEKSGKREVCPNIFDNGSSTTQGKNVNIGSIKQFIFNVNNENAAVPVIGLNVSFRFPSDVGEHGYRGALIRLTAREWQHCYYLNFTEPLRERDVFDGEESITLHFDCFRPVDIGKDYNVAIILYSRNSMSNIAEEPITIHSSCYECGGAVCTYNGTVPKCSCQQNDLIYSESLNTCVDPCVNDYPCGDAICTSNGKTYLCSCQKENYIYISYLKTCVARPIVNPLQYWKPHIQELTFVFPNATLRFNLGEHKNLQYMIILQKCSQSIFTDSKQCDVDKEDSVLVKVVKNTTSHVSRFKAANKEPLSYLPTDVGRVFLTHEDKDNGDKIFFVVVEFYFVEEGIYQFTLRSESSECKSFCQKTTSEPANNTGNNVCSKYQCQKNAHCQLNSKNIPACACVANHILDSADQCIYEPCTHGWCLKKTVAVIAATGTFLLVLLFLLFYTKKRRKSLRNTTDPNVDEENSDDRRNFDSLQDLKKFSERCNSISRESKASKFCDSSISSEYMMLSTSDTSGSCRSAPRL